MSPYMAAMAWSPMNMGSIVEAVLQRADNNNNNNSNMTCRAP